MATQSATPAYDRDAFEHWVDADGDGCDTRAEMLIAESTTTASIGNAHRAAVRSAFIAAPPTPRVCGHDTASDHDSIKFQALADDGDTEVSQTGERGQVRASEARVERVEPFLVGSVRTSIVGKPPAPTAPATPPPRLHPHL